MYCLIFVLFIFHLNSAAPDYVQKEGKQQEISETPFTSPQKIMDIREDRLATKQQILDAKFDKKYNIKINISNVDPNYAALCVITKNDNIYDLHEFLSYHFKIGIGRIYLYDTGTNNQDQFKVFKFFSEFLSDGRLFYSYWEQGPAQWQKNMQVDLYSKCTANFAQNHKWLGFIDTDEFIVLRNIRRKKKENQVQNIQDFLKQYEDYGGLTMNWVLFGSSGFEKHQRSALKSYTKCVLHSNVKTFVNVRFLNMKKNNVKMGVHSLAKKYMKNKQYVVDEDFQKQQNWIFNKHFPSHKIVLFHYVLKSLEDYQVKMKRGDASGFQVRQMIFFDFVNQNANYTCTEGVQLYKQLFQSQDDNDDRFLKTEKSENKSWFQKKFSFLLDNLYFM